MLSVLDYAIQSDETIGSMRELLLHLCPGLMAIVHSMRTLKAWHHFVSDFFLVKIVVKNVLLPHITCLD